MQAGFSINGKLLFSYAKRFWPLWLVFLCAWMLLCVMPLFGMLSAAYPGMYETELDLIEAQQSIWAMSQAQIVPIAWAAAIAAAICVNERLFIPKAAAFYGSLPLLRSTVFASAFLAGFLPLVCVEAVVALVLLALSTTAVGIGGTMVLGWFGLAVGCTFTFYALATLLCELTGSRAVAVVLYLVANVLASCIEGAIRLITGSMLYGITFGEMGFDWASPVIGLMRYCLWSGAYTSDGFGGSANFVALGLYCLFGIVCVAVALWLDGRRGLEAAGEAISFPALRPVLKYLAGICSALLFGGCLYIFFWMSNSRDVSLDATGAIAMALFMALGGALGVVVAQMVMSKSSHVLHESWKGALAVACASVLFVGICFADVLGMVGYIPVSGQVESVELLADRMKVADVESPEAVEEVCSLHGDILAHRGEISGLGENAFSTEVGICYHLKDGKLVERFYSVACPRDAEGNALEDAVGAQILKRANAVANAKEARLSRIQPVVDDPRGCEIWVNVPGGLDENGERAWSNTTLSGAQAKDFVEQVLVPDAENDSVGKGSYFWYEYEGDEITNPQVRVEVYDDKGRSIAEYWPEKDRTPHTLAWLKENGLI